LAVANNEIDRSSRQSNTTGSAACRKTASRVGAPASELRIAVSRSVKQASACPNMTDIDAWFAALDRFTDVPFMEEGRQQPPMPTAEDLLG
jgi:hypothetical protein